MKAVIVGCGSIAPVHIRALIKNGITVHALCDIVPQRAAKLKQKFDLSCAVYTDYREMLRGSVPDCVHICTPHYLHADMAAEALRRGINVICEKPICISDEDMRTVTDALKNTSAQLGVCFQNRYVNANLHLKRYLETKRITGVIAHVFWSRDEEYYRSAPWRGKKEFSGGGLLINQAIHTLDLIQWLSGMPKELCGDVANRHLKGIIDVEDTADCYWREGGVEAVFFGTTSSGFHSPAYIKFLTEDGCTAELIEGSCFIDGKEIDTGIGGEVLKDYWGDGHAAFTEDFYNCLKEGKKFPLGYEEGIKAVKLVLAINRSKGEFVAVD